MKIFRSAICTLAFALLPQLAWSVDLAPVKDNWILRDNPNNSAGASVGIFAGNNNNKSPRHGLIQFDVAASLPAGVTITGATLTLTLAQAPALGPYMVDLHRLTADWGEGNKSAGSLGGMGQGAGAGDATWNENAFGTSSWATPGGDYAPAVSASAAVGNTIGQAYNFTSPTLLSDVVNWYLNPGNNHGWALVNQSEGPNDQQTVKVFHSREATSANVRPVLSITYVPEPTSIGLAFLACPIGALYRRRKRCAAHE